MQRMYIGAHVSTAGGLSNALSRAESIEAEAIQIFPSAPLRWKISFWSDQECEQFKARWPKKFKQVVFHGIYLLNLASETSDGLAKTKQALIETMKLSAKLGIEATIIHPGTYKDGKIAAAKQIKQALSEVLSETPAQTKLVFENSAGGTIGGALEDLALLLELVKDASRAAVCLDTCHAFAAGYDISNQQGYENYIKEIDRTIGLNNVYCWHLNDSKFGLGQRRDRHENIGEGKLGLDCFSRLVNDSRWAQTAGYLETPGFDNQGPDLKNVKILKSLRRQVKSS